MSWINNLNGSFQQISSLTGQLGGQLSSFTREVLAEQEDSEIVAVAEVDDVKKLKLKLVQFQELAKAQADEVNRQKQLNLELEARFKSAESETDSKLREYRQKMESQNRVINDLKFQLEPAAAGQKSAQQQSIDDGGYHVIVHKSADDKTADFGDVISARQEIVRLSSRVESLEEDLRRASSLEERNTSEIDWKAKYTELERQLNEQMLEYEDKLLQLEHDNAATVKRYENKIEQMKVKMESVSPSPSAPEDGQELVHIKIDGLTTEIDELNEKLMTRNRQLQAQKTTITELRSRLEQTATSEENSGTTLTEDDDNNKETRLIEGLLHVLPQLCGKLPTDHDVIDDILDAVSKLQESFERNEDRNSFSSFSYECVEYDGDAASSDAYGEKNGEGQSKKSSRLLDLKPPRHQSSPRISIRSSAGSEVKQQKAAIGEVCEEDSIVDVMFSTTVHAHQEKTNRLKQEMKDLMENNENSKHLDGGGNTQEKLSTTSSAISQLERKMRTLREQYEAERDEHSVSRLQLEETVKEKEDLRSGLSRIAEELEESRSEQKELNEALEALDVQHGEEMSQLLLIREQLDAKVKEMEHQLVAIEEEKQSLDIRVKQLEREQAEKHESETIASNKMLMDAKNELSKLKDELAATMREKEELTEKSLTAMQELEAELRKSTEARLESELMAIHKEKETMNMKMMETEEQWRNELVRKTEEVTALQSDIESLNHAKSRLENEVDTIREDGYDVERSLNEDLKAARDQLNKANEAKSRMRSDLEKAEEEYKELERSVEDRESKISLLNIEIDNLKKQNARDRDSVLAANSDKIAELSNDNKDIVKRMKEEYKTNVDRLREDHEQSMAALRDEQRRVQDDRDRLQQEVSMQKLQIRELDEKIKVETQMSDERLLLTDEERNESRKMREDQRMLREQLEESESSLSKLKESESSLQMQVEDLKKKIEDEKASRKSLDGEVENYKQENLRLKSNLDENERKLEQVEETYKNETDKLAMDLKELTEVKQRINELEAALKEANNKNIPSQDEEKCDVSKEDVNRLMDLLKERDQVIESLTEKNSQLSLHSDTVTSQGESNQLRQFEEEKDQMLAIISEKTRENRELKNEARTMIDAISSDKETLQKLQSENKEFRDKYEGFDHEMTKDTVKRLSKMISEKDLEIESLKQKCQTLLDVLQQQDNRDQSSDKPSYSSQQIDQLIKERETLTNQVRQLMSDRAQLVTLAQTKHQEALQMQQEAARAAEAVERDAAENSQLQIRYTNLVFEYDQIQLKLTAVQRELERIKEMMRNLQNFKKSLVTKVEGVATADEAMTGDGVTKEDDDVRSSLAEKSKQVEQKQQRGDGEVSGKVEELQSVIEKKIESLLQKDLLVQDAMRRSADSEKKVEEQRKELRDKDFIIKRGSEEISKISADLNKKVAEISILKKSVENLREQIAEMGELRKRVEMLQRSSREKDSETEAFQETNAHLSMMLKGQEYEKQNLKEQVTRLESILKQQEEGKDTETQKYLQEIDRYRSEATTVKHERDQFMLSLKQKQLESQRYSEELRQLQEREGKLQSELNRLRTHLVQVEESYTNEAVLAEERETDLRDKWEQEREKSEKAQQTNEHAKKCVDSLQVQLREVIAQRDQTVQQYQLAQEKVRQYAGAVNQLKTAAERMQRDEAATYAAQLDKINKKLALKEKEAEAKSRELDQVQAKLDEVHEGLELASRLSEQLVAREEDLERAREIVAEKQTQIEELQNLLNSINARNENMVDRQLVKNLFIGYFSSPPNKRDDVIRLITSMIGFSKEEMNKLSPRRKGGWVGSLLSWGVDATSMNNTNVMKRPMGGDLNESFTQMFVKFLESESQAKQPAARLPAVAMATETQQRSSQRKFSASSSLSAAAVPATTSAGIPTPAHNPPQSEAERERGTVAGRYNPPIVIPNPLSIVGSVGGSSSAHPFAQPPSFSTTFSPLVRTAASASNEQNILQGILQTDNNKT